MPGYRELLIGCGNNRRKLIHLPDRPEWVNLETVDIDPNCRADHEIDLLRCNLAETFGEDAFDELHGYHILEHLGAQGDFRFFFRQWHDFWRVLKPAGLFCGIVPLVGSAWAWADPGHTKVLPPEFTTYLDLSEYEYQVGKTALADYRWCWSGDFQKVYERFDRDHDQYMFVLRAVKPAGGMMQERAQRVRESNEG